MALDSPYATAKEFRAAVGADDEKDDAAITALLKAVSRLLDRRCRRFFSKNVAAVARIFHGNGRELLWLPIDIATTAGLIVKVDLNGDYDVADSGETLALNTDYWLGPENAELEPEAQPFESIEVNPSSALLSCWPDQRRAIEVTAVFGWPARPGAVREATILIARELLDLEKAGMTLQLQQIDQQVNLSPAAFSQVQRIQHDYARPLTRR
jgi:hypothetical protein